jgi:hypothetical protein
LAGSVGTAPDSSPLSELYPPCLSREVALSNPAAEVAFEQRSQDPVNHPSDDVSIPPRLPGMSAQRQWFFSGFDRFKLSGPT